MFLVSGLPGTNTIDGSWRRLAFPFIAEIIEEFYSDQFIIGLGSGGNFVNEGTKIRFEVYPAMDGFVTVSVPENAMIDPSLNGNFASDVLTVLSGTPVSKCFAAAQIIFLFCFVFRRPNASIHQPYH